MITSLLNELYSVNQGCQTQFGPAEFRSNTQTMQFSNKPEGLDYLDQVCLIRVEAKPEMILL